MRILVLHAASGDTLAAVVRTEELDLMGVSYTEIFPTGELNPLIAGCSDLKEDLDLLLSTYIAKCRFGL